MSLLSTRTSRTKTESGGKRRRSESVSGIRDVAHSRRTPHSNYSEENDVATMVCAELSRGILMSPKIDTGVFFKTTADSRRDINKSDTTVLLACAILDHLGNKSMASRLLSKSSTLSKYYDELNLNNSQTRGIFVTMIFALSPDFVAMVEKTLILTVQRSAAEASGKRDDDPVVTALAKLTISNHITPDELRRSGSFDNKRKLSLSPEAERFSLQATPTEFYSPELAAAIRTNEKQRRYKIAEGDLMAFSRRRQSGSELDFSEVFPSAIAPIALEGMNNTRKAGNRRGIGYNVTAGGDNEHIQAMNRILGSHNVKSVDLNSGEVRIRKPNVEDYLESESVSGSVYERVPDVASVYDSTPYVKNVMKPLPTEYQALPSTIGSETTARPALNRVDSFEELLKREGNYY